MSYADYFLKSHSDVVQLELLEISHPAFSKVYRIVRNAINGVTVTLENSQQATFDYYPVKITPSQQKGDLDHTLKISFGDLGEVLPSELDLVTAANQLGTKPTLIYRTYRSDDLSTPLYGPIQVEIVEITFNKEGATFEAKAPTLNTNQTGQAYTFERFPMLKGFL